MKIKNPDRKHRIRQKLKETSFHWWLVKDKPKSSGRLGQLNKANRTLRNSVGASEFVTMARRIEERQAYGNA